MLLDLLHSVSRQLMLPFYNGVLQCQAVAYINTFAQQSCLQHLTPRTGASIVRLMKDGDADGLYREIGRKIREARERVTPKLSQDKLAKRLGMSRASMVNIEAGRQHPPLHVLWQIAEILGVDPFLLIPRRDELSGSNPTTQLDKATLKEIRRAAKGDPETQKALANFVSKLKTSLESTDEKGKS